MGKSKRILLVEGVNDRSFYERLCQAHKLDTKVTIAPPRDVGGDFNTKQGAINHLPNLLKLMPDAQLERLALIVDADNAADGGGYSRTVAQISKLLGDFGFETKPTKVATGGLVFQHKDGLADFGLWVMPNNQDEGILEDWIQQSIVAGDHPLSAHAKAIVASLPNKKFTPVRLRKAEVATWLAWQARPGEGLYYAVEGNLLDKNAPLYTGLKSWLVQVFG